MMVKDNKKNRQRFGCARKSLLLPRFFVVTGLMGASLWVMAMLFTSSDTGSGTTSSAVTGGDRNSAGNSKSASGLRQLLQSNQPQFLTYEVPPAGLFPRTSFTLDDFVVNGVNLAKYGFESKHDLTTATHKNQKHTHDSTITTTIQPPPKAHAILTKPYKLYDSFNIGPLIAGTEGWWDLIAYHGEMIKMRELIFYADKIAFKRFMQAVKIPHAKSHVLKYKHELLLQQPSTSDNNDSTLHRRLSTAHSHDDKDSKNKHAVRRLTAEDKIKNQELLSIQNLLPRRTNFVAKPSHTSCSKGVWMIQYDEATGKNSVGYGRARHLDDNHYDEEGKKIVDIANKLSEHLYVRAPSKTWSLLQVKPGIMVEDRFTAYDTDDKPAMEFKVFTIWGRVWIAYWKRGGTRPGLVYRNGTVVDWKEKQKEFTKLPDWVDWNRVVEVAERMARHKDFMRIDIFVGIPAGDPVLSKKEGQVATLEEQRKAVQYVVNEVDHRPTCYFQDEIHNEGARLWMAGYKMGIYQVVPNTEVPKAFMDKAYLTEDDAKELEMPPGVWWNQDE